MGSSLSSLPKKFGRYEVLKELGKGAMGVVYLGRDPVIGRMVALKTIRVVGEDEDEQKEFGERFLREAQAAGILSHPNIVTVHDVGEDPDTHISFIAMEYVEGKNLKQLVGEKTVMSFERIADVVGQVAEALDYAHRKGIVHRDVKPANVIITPEGAIKITDFGIAKIEKSSLTSTGQFLGTPNYMSPEQVTGETVDGRSDLFSLGVVLYELLTRKKPFSGENLTSISYKIVHEPFTPPETFDAEIPPEFGPILLRALGKNPADRYQRGRELALALYEFKARQEERDMLRDLGQMVAAAENLGGVAAVDFPTARLVVSPPVAPAQAELPPQEEPAREVDSAAPADLGGDFELASFGAEPVGVASKDAPLVDYSAPDWTLETGKQPVAGPEPKSAARTELEPAVLSPAEPVSPPPADPLDGVTERLDMSKHAPFLAAAPEPARIGPVSPASVVPTPAPHPSFLDVPPVPEKTERIVTGIPPRRPVPPPAPAVVPPRPAVLPPPPPVPSVPLARVAAPPAAPAEVSAAPSEEPAVARPASGAQQPPVKALKRDVNPRFAAIILGCVALAGLLVVGFLGLRQRGIRAVAPVDDAVVKETQERRRLMTEGEQLSAQGKYEEALASYRELARRSPESAAARAAVASTEQLLATQQTQQKEQETRATDLAAHLAAAREAEGVPDDARVVKEAEAALAIDPANAEGKAIKEAAEARLATKSAAEKKREAALAAKKKVKPTPTPEPVAAAAPARATSAAPAATPGMMTMRITFSSPVPRGLLMVGVGNSIVFRKDFDFGKNSSGGQVEGSVTVPSGPHTVKVWLIATDRSLKPYRTTDLVLPGGETKTLAISLDSSQNLSFGLR